MLTDDWFRFNPLFLVQCGSPLLKLGRHKNPLMLQSANISHNMSSSEYEESGIILAAVPESTELQTLGHWHITRQLGNISCKSLQRLSQTPAPLKHRFWNYSFSVNIGPKEQEKLRNIIESLHQHQDEVFVTHQQSESVVCMVLGSTEAMVN